MYPVQLGRGAPNWMSQALIVSLLAIALAPLVIGLGYAIPAVFVNMFAGRSHYTPPAQLDDGYQQEVSGTQSGQWQDPRKRQLPSNQELVVKMWPVSVVLLSAALVLLLWGLSSTTTANLLARLGARPAHSDGREGEAARTIERLSMAVGIAPPRFYVVECSFPTTFSVAIDSQHGMLATTSGTLELLNPAEFDTLLAHELSHLFHRDSRLDPILASLGAVAEYPFRMFGRRMSLAAENRSGVRTRLALLEAALSPLGLYVFFALPFLNRAVEFLVSRSREFRADADAALLTGNPAGLACALAKIGGVTTALGKSTVSSLPGHTSLPQRIGHLMELYQVPGFVGLEDAVAQGKRYAAERPAMGDNRPGLAASPRDHIAAVSQGNVMGRVIRVLSTEPVPVYDKAAPGALVMARVKPGSLLVAFDVKGKMLQVNTAQEVFGYVSREVKVQPLPGILPQEVYDRKRCAAIEESLARQEEHRPPEAPAVAEAPGILPRQYVWIALGFGAAVFAGTTILLLVLAR